MVYNGIVVVHENAAGVVQILQGLSYMICSCVTKVFASGLFILDLSLVIPDHWNHPRGSHCLTCIHFFNASGLKIRFYQVVHTSS